MDKKIKRFKRILLILLVIVLSNLPPLHFFCVFIGESGHIIDGFDQYVTKDKKYAFEGGLRYLEQSPYYPKYKKMYPNADHTLYRIEPIRVWRFWRWREYLTSTKWKQKYMEIDASEYRILSDKIYRTGELYNTEE